MENTYDVIIIGAGPAGMTAAIYASRAELKVLLIEAGVPGGKVALTSSIENWPGDTLVSGPELAEQMQRHALAFGARLINAVVSGIEIEGPWRVVRCGDERYRAKACIVASGTVERHLGVPGEKEYYGLGVSYCAVCDGAFFRNRSVVVVGGGSTAFEDAIYLTRFAKEVKVVTRRDVSRAEKTTQSRLRENPKIEWLKNYKPLEILGEDGMVTGIRLVGTQDGKELQVECSGVFPMIGLDANTAFLKDFPELLDADGFVLADEHMATRVPGLFSAGDVNAKVLRQIVTATADGSIAAQSAAHYIENWQA